MAPPVGGSASKKTAPVPDSGSGSRGLGGPGPAARGPASAARLDDVLDALATAWTRAGRVGEAELLGLALDGRGRSTAIAV